MSPLDFETRRKKLMPQIGEGNIALIPSAPDRTRNRDVNYPFRQDSDFYYLTGFNESGALAIFIPQREQGEYILFCREFDEKKKLWEGSHSGLEGATTDYRADDAFPIEDLHDILPGLLENKGKVFYPMGRDQALDHQLLTWIHHFKLQSRHYKIAPSELVSIEPILHEMRLFKSTAELALMRKVAQISAKAHIRAMKSCRAGLYEYQIEAEIVHEFMQSGLRSVAYPSIVAGGKNACILHYVNNKAKLQKNDLLLIDAGGEYEHYAADITRTFPVSGKFSMAQKQLYQLVLEVQLAAIAQIKPGIPWNDLHQQSIKMMTSGLIELGLLTGNVNDLIENKSYKTFYMHRLGHWLGMDVHDVGDYKMDEQSRILAPGMVITIEPGLYVQADCKSVAAQWRGIGVRIEDDVLVTADGCEVLSADAPKTIADIEELMQEN